MNRSSQTYVVEHYRATPAGHIPLHEHADLWEVAWTVSGCGLRTFGEHTDRFGPGELTLTPPGIPHTWLYDSDKTDSDGKVEGYVILIKDDWIREVMRVVPAIEVALRPLFERNASVVASRNVRKRLMQLISGLEKFPPARQALRVLDILLAFAEDVERALLQHRQKRDPREDVRMELLTYVKCNAMKDISIQVAAKEFGKSRSAFCAWFKAMTGQTFNATVVEARLKDVCERLRSTAATVGEISDATGFSDAAYLSRLFKRTFGCSPTQWRRQNGRLDT